MGGGGCSRWTGERGGGRELLREVRERKGG